MSQTYHIISNYTSAYNNPIILNIGDRVTLGVEEQEEKWLGWIWAENYIKDYTDRLMIQKGWVPIQILHIADNRKTAVVCVAYTAQELTVHQGEMITKVTSLNGWSWVKNINTQAEGWIPDEVIGTQIKEGNNSV